MKENNNKKESFVLFAFLVIAVLAIGIPLIFFLDPSETSRLHSLEYITSEQDIIINNVTGLRSRVDYMLNVELVNLRSIVVYEEDQIPILDRLFEDINCTGVKRINGVVPDPTTRSFNITGVHGIDMVDVAPDQLYLNATALDNQYRQEQQSINTQFENSVNIQLAIDLLSTEVLKSLNFFVSRPNINISGICGTVVYTQSNDTVVVDMCALASNATAAFEGITFEFEQVENELNQLLIEMQVILNQTNTIFAAANLLYAEAIFTINNVTTSGNNIDLLAGTGFTVTNGGASNEISIKNVGLVSMNNMIVPGILITNGEGVVITDDPVLHKTTITNEYAVSPCQVRMTSTNLILSWLTLSTGWASLLQIWTPQVQNPSGCTPTTVFEAAVCLGPVPCGIFTMPEGIWIMAMYLDMTFVQGFNVQVSFAFRSLLYEIPLQSISFQQQFSGNFYHGLYHYEITLSSLIIPAGTQFQLQYQAYVNGGGGLSPITASNIVYYQFNMTKIV